MVGKVNRISIQEDAWLARAKNYRVYGNINNSNIEKVYDLIDHSHRKWNVGLIKDTFEESVAEKILRLPLARLEHEDMLVWRGEPSGVFSVRSAYKLLLKGGRDNQHTDFHNTMKGLYKNLWKLKLTTK
ncbi:hypothetical protein V6Z12_D12G025400 [Gossypium hirsutum]